MEKIVVDYELELGKLKTQYNEVINKFNQLEASGKKSTKGVQGGVDDLEKKLNNFGKSTLTSVAAAVGVAFSVDAIIQFSKSSVSAFLEAEKNAKRLEGVLRNISGEGQGAFDRLIKQSVEFQKISIFSDDQIQQAQTALVTFGLTSKEVEKLIPKILDFASATGDDLGTATDKVIQGINGQVRGLRLSGVAFKDTGDKAENYNILLDRLSKFTGQAGVAAETTSGQIKILENSIDDSKESFGEFIIELGKDIGLLATGGPFAIMNKNLREQQEILNKSLREGAEKSLGDISNLTLDQLNKRLKLSHDTEAILLKQGNKNAITFQQEKTKLLEGAINKAETKQFELDEKNAEKRKEAEKTRTKSREDEQKRQRELTEKFAIEDAITEVNSQEKQTAAFDAGIKARENIATDSIKRTEELEASALEQRKIVAEQEREITDLRLQTAFDATNTLIQLAGQESSAGKDFIVLQKGIAIAEIIINTQRELAAINANPLVNLDVTQALRTALITAAIVRSAGILATIGSIGFAKGVIDLDGKGTETSDSIPARLSKGESVMTAKETRKYKDELLSIRKGKFEDLVFSDYVLPALRQQHKKKEDGFAESIARSYQYNNQFSDTNIVKSLKRVAKSEDIYDLISAVKSGTNLRKF